MKYQIGERVKYDTGDWIFFGTISAIIENSIHPCYRLIVDRMEKKNCKLSITHFEFDFLPCEEQTAGSNIIKSENSEIQPSITPPLLTPVPAVVPEQLPVQPAPRKLSKKRNPIPKQKFQPDELQPDELQPDQRQPDELQPDQRQPDEPLQEQQNPEEILPEEHLPEERLLYERPLEERLPEEPAHDITEKTRKPAPEKHQNKSDQSNNLWELKIKQWKSGKHEALRSWRQKVVRLYTNGKLSQSKIDQLKAIGILD